MENRFEIQGNCLIIHLPKEVDHMVTDEIRRDSDEKNISGQLPLIFLEQHLWTVRVSDCSWEDTG